MNFAEKIREEPWKKDVKISTLPIIVGFFKWIIDAFLNKTVWTKVSGVSA